MVALVILSLFLRRAPAPIPKKEIHPPRPVIKPVVLAPPQRPKAHTTPKRVIPAPEITSKKKMIIYSAILHPRYEDF